MSKVYLVSCVSIKQEMDSKAEDLYQSQWFLKAKDYVKSSIKSEKGDRWFILSAKHGLLEPGEVISNYNETLNFMKSTERQNWAISTFTQICQKISPSEDVEILAGAKYREYLEPALLERGHSVNVPLRGLGIGEQLSALKKMGDLKEQEVGLALKKEQPSQMNLGLF